MIQIDSPTGPLFIDEATGRQITPESLRAMARSFAIEAGIDPDIFERQIEAESGFDPNASSPAGAQGIAQIVPQWHPGVDTSDPEASLRYAANLMASHLKNYNGDYATALAAYNAGPGAVQQYGGVPPFAETQGYIAKILGGAPSTSGAGSTGGGGAKPLARPLADDSEVTREEDQRNSGLTGSGQTGTSGSRPFNPNTDRITDRTPVAGGEQVVYIGADGQRRTAFIPGARDSNTVSATTQAQLGEQRRQFDLQFANAQTPAERQANLAEQKRQFDEGFGFDKAKFNTQVNLDKGKTLLSLGSLPDTLIKYLYALRGQQVPQGFENTTQNLPGFENVLGTGGAAAPAVAPKSAAPAIAPAPALTPAASVPAAAQITAAQALAGQRTTQGATLAPNSGVALNTPLPNIGPLGTAPNLTQPSLQLARPAEGPAQVQIPQSGGGVGLTPTNAVLANVQTNAAGASAPVSLSDWAVKNGFNLAKYADGGVIPEPVVGQGILSGRPYLFGEQGPETVVPGAGKAPRGDGTYATGGTIGYQPFAPPDLFNPSGLAGNISGPTNPNGNPNFPQFDHFTGGGESLIPSAQRLGNSLGSERSLYSGFLQDEAGVVPDDVFEMAKKLAPQVSGLRTPRFAA